jgi:branched-chain amino acid transport system permease protein
VLIVLSALLGGRGTVWGPVLGAFIIEPLANFTSTDLGGADAGAIRLLMFGGLLGAVVLFLPRGVLPTLAVHLPHRRSPADAAVDSTPRETPGRVSELSDAPALQVSGLHKAFGGLRAVDGVDLTVEGRSVTGLIGPNGSGKTTLFNLIDATIATSSGRIVLCDRRVERSGRAARAHAGLARTYQLPRLFPNLTVVENIVLPERSPSIRRLFLSRVTNTERRRAMLALAELGLTECADSSPATLSYGQRKLIEFAQVLWLDPVLVMLDEPAAGISPALSQLLAGKIRALRSRGVSVLLVEHDLAFLASLCDQVHVIANGKIIASGTVAEVGHDRAVVDAYLGDELTLAPAEIPA